MSLSKIQWEGGKGTQSQQDFSKIDSEQEVLICKMSHSRKRGGGAKKRWKTIKERSGTNSWNFQSREGTNIETKWKRKRQHHKNWVTQRRGTVTTLKRNPQTTIETRLFMWHSGGGIQFICRIQKEEKSEKSEGLFWEGGGSVGRNVSWLDCSWVAPAPPPLWNVINCCATQCAM